MSLHRQASARTPLSAVLVACVATALALFAAVFAGAAAPAAPSPPVPVGPIATPKIDPAKVDPALHHRIAAVNAELAVLARRNDRLDEQYNVAVAAVAAQQQKTRQAQQVAAQAAADYRAAHSRFLQALTSQYEGGSTASVGVLLGSNDPQAYLDGLNLAEYLNKQFAGVVVADHAARARATSTAQAAAHDLAAAQQEQAALATQRTALQQQQQKFADLLHSLSARERHEIAHARAVAAARARARAAALAAQAAQAAAGTPPAAGSVPGSVSAQVRRVIAYAEAQVGKPYVFGAAGPNVFDCSGLTLAAWAQVGVQLPHSAAEQYGYGHHVSYSQLQPGDLIFLYTPIDHVELYVGNDLAVSAADPALGVLYVHPSQDLADFAGATRLAG